jgi:2-oxoglutarate dehydrogenase E1 component
MGHVEVATRWNLSAIEDAHRRWRDDPLSVDPSWRYFFEGFELGGARAALPAADPHCQTGIVRLIDAYRDLGHFLAHLDPLSDQRATHPLLDLAEFDLDETDLDRTFDTSHFVGLPQATLRELLAALRETYCRTIGVEYMHIQDTRIRRWLQERMEPRRNRPNFGRDKKLTILKELHYAEMFERFLHTRYVGQKRFSLEGAETLIPVLEAFVEMAPETGVREIVMGMSHRGRLNVLTNTLRKPYQEVFAEFEENFLPDSIDGDGDVKYHLGFSGDRTTSAGKPLHLSLTPNPSHLEAVDPVVEGRMRAKQFRFGDVGRRRGIPLLIHGDAAFAGQGLVAETLNLSELAGYTTGGTLHVIVNNQIGFTTAPKDARSTTYCTDVAKMIQVPIFHVNGEDPEACVYIAELSLDFRQTFGRDVVIDMFCYRRHGHNEGDEPAFTQPLMYKKIAERPTLTEVYTEQLIMRGDLTVAETEAVRSKFQAKLQAAHAEIRQGDKETRRQGDKDAEGSSVSLSPCLLVSSSSFQGQWQGLTSHYSHAPAETGVPDDVLKTIADALTRVPDHLSVHPKIAKLLEARREEFVRRHPVDWATAEALAFGSLLLEGTPVRLSGQDSRRGTFSQRHSVLYDARTGAPYYPLNALSKDQAPFLVYDSLLSEAAVLGFEFGYALDSPEVLVLWEAQFGDFANGAQVIIDQFIAASQSKWQRDSGLVMLLPHGYEGQGPEHSSARLERFLQLCADDNMQVAYPSAPAQYFHVLRRQMKRDFRKPLVLMTPKSLLRLKAAASPIEELVSGRFHEVIDDTQADPGRVRRVVLCSGKLYYELLERRNKEEGGEVALVRVEQFYPFPEGPLAQALSRYRKAREHVWAQEESQNMGAWTFLEPRLRAMGYGVEYVGRDASASPATGSRQVHLREQKEIVEAAIRLPVPHLVRAAPKDNGRAAVPQPVVSH